MSHEDTCWVVRGWEKEVTCWAEDDKVSEDIGDYNIV